jgi:hypothetical protein
MISVPLFKGFIFQISYVIFSSMGFLGLLIYLWVRHCKELSNELWGVTLYVILLIVVVALISDLHNTPHPALGYFVPNGRYLTQFVPILMILFFSAIRFWVSERRVSSPTISMLHVGTIFFIQAMIVLLATPLWVLVPASLVNNPDLGLFFAPEIFPFNRGLPWRGWPHEPSFLLLLGSILLLLPSILAMVGVLRNWSIRLLVIPQIVLVAAGSVIQFGGINIMQDTQKTLNMLFRSTANVCAVVSYFDKDMPATNEEFMHRFWCNGHGMQRKSWKDFKETAIAKPEIEDALFITRLDRIPQDGTGIEIVFKNADYVVITIKAGDEG